MIFDDFSEFAATKGSIEIKVIVLGRGYIGRSFRSVGEKKAPNGTDGEFFGRFIFLIQGRVYNHSPLIISKNLPGRANFLKCCRGGVWGGEAPPGISVTRRSSFVVVVVVVVIRRR